MKGEIEKLLVEAHTKLLEQVDNYLFETLNAKKGEITSREDLKRYSFLCPICNKKKNALEAVLLTDCKFKWKLNIVTVIQKILLVCRGCSRKLWPKEGKRGDKLNDRSENNRLWFS